MLGRRGTKVPRNSEALAWNRQRLTTVADILAFCRRSKNSQSGGRPTVTASLFGLDADFPAASGAVCDCETASHGGVTSCVVGRDADIKPRGGEAESFPLPRRVLCVVGC
jgi:hypothetical protein